MKLYLCAEMETSSGIKTYRKNAHPDYEADNADFLHSLGYDWDVALDIAAWATGADEGDEIKPDEIPEIRRVYISRCPRKE